MKSIIPLTLFISSVFGVQFYCEPGYQPITGFQLDLSKLNQDFVVYQNTSTPPTTTSIVTQINICNELSLPNEPDNLEICPKGSLICRRTIHVKNKVENINVVQTIARNIDDKLSPQFAPVNAEEDSTKNGYKYSLTLNGGEYVKRPQSATIELICDESQSRKDTPKSPEILYYRNNVLGIQWKTVFACATKVGEKIPDDKKPESPTPAPQPEGGRSIFTIIIVIAAIYFVGGAIYNYRMFNATGLDLLPHRDFWLELPYIIKDFITYTMDRLTSQRSRSNNGYVSV